MPGVPEGFAEQKATFQLPDHEKCIFSAGDLIENALFYTRINDRFDLPCPFQITLSDAELQTMQVIVCFNGGVHNGTAAALVQVFPLAFKSQQHGV